MCERPSAVTADNDDTGVLMAQSYGDVTLASNGAAAAAAAGGAAVADTYQTVVYRELLHRADCAR